MTNSSVGSVPASAPDGRVMQDENRSRSPPSGGRGVLTQHSGAASAQFPVTGVALTERWYEEHVTEPLIMQDFLELPQWRRKSVILKCMDKPPENVHSWIFAVIRNFRTSELEKRLSTQASAQQARSFPSPMMSIPPGGLPLPDQRHHEVLRQSAPLPLPVLPLSASAGARDVIHDPPRWAAELIALWPSQKSRLVAHFLSLLSPPNQAAVSTMLPQTQACVALAVALVAQQHSSADALAMECVRRLSSSGCGRPMPTTDAVSASPAASSLQLQLVFVAPESSVSLVLAKSFIVAMERMSPGAFSYLPLIVISLHEGPSLAAEAERLKLGMNSTTTSLASLETFVESSKVNFKAYNVKTLFVSMVHAVNGVVGRGTSQRSAAALHGENFRFLWTVARCSQILRSTTGDEAVCELVFAPPKMDDEMKLEVAKLAGPMTSTANVSYNGVAPAPTVFGTPGGSAMVKVCKGSDYETQPIDDWRVAADPRITEDVPGGFITFIAKTAEVAVFQERLWSPIEQKLIEDFTMSHAETGERRLCSRDWWLRWYGYVKTPLQTMLTLQHPCHSVIFSVTGSQSPADTAGGEPCGKQRFCVQCEKVFSFLDGTYCLPVMVDAAVALMVKARQLWSSQCQGDPVFARSVDVNRMHQCGPTCAFAV